MSNPRLIRDYDLEKIKTVPKNSIFKLIFSRICISGLLIILQIIVLAAVTLSWSERHTKEVILLFIVLVSAGIFIVILNSESNPTYKISWIIPVALLPFFGSLLYLLSHYNIGSIASTKAVCQSLKDTETYSHTSPDVQEALYRQNRRVAALSKYIENAGGYATYRNTSVKYFSLGDYAFPEMVKQLEKAKYFIFLEFFIIKEGIFWNTLLEILQRKAREGVEVRVMYDDIGCMTTLPRDYLSKSALYGNQSKDFCKSHSVFFHAL